MLEEGYSRSKIICGMRSPNDKGDRSKDKIDLSIERILKS